MSRGPAFLVSAAAALVLALAVYLAAGRSNGGSETAAQGSDAEAKASRRATSALPEAVVRARTAHWPRRMSGLEIIISHVEAPEKLRGTTRSRDEARQRAEEAHSKALTPDVSFETVVQEYTDDAGGARSDGWLGIIRSDQRVRKGYDEIIAELRKLEIGGVSGILESPFGFHILKRIPIEEYAAGHIWIQYRGSEGATAERSRSREEALALAETVLSELREGKASFPELVFKYSEDYEPLKNLGGLMGVFERHALQVGAVRGLGDALFKLEIGEFSGVVESPYGFHVLTRLPLERYQMSAAQILIRHAEGIGAPPSIQRTKEEARALAEKIHAELSQPEADFAELARRWSEHPTAAEGGNLGTVPRGNVSLPPGVEEMVFALRPGEISDVFETPQGFHILLRCE